MNPLPEPVVLALSRLSAKAPEDVELVRLHIQALQSQKALSDLLTQQVDVLEAMDKTLTRLEPVLAAGVKALEVQAQSTAESAATAGWWRSMASAAASNPALVTAMSSIATVVLTFLALWLGIPAPMVQNLFRSEHVRPIPASHLPPAPGDPQPTP